LLTGAGGQLGHDLEETLRDHELRAYDHAGLDVADRDAVLREVERVRPECIINAAAFNDVDGAETAAEAAFAVNGAGPGFLAAAAKGVGASMVHISTDYVFDGSKGSAYTEADTPNPLSVYGKSKYEGERRVLESGASVCVLRTAWLYGHHGKNFVKAILYAATKGGPLRVVADQVGSPTATADLAQAIGQLITTPARGLFHVANVGSCSRFEFAQAIVRGKVKVLAITSADAARPARRPADSSLVSIKWPRIGIMTLPSWQVALDKFLGGTLDYPQFGDEPSAQRRS
jgi:dTDP-4-dehydrorhamnose reductase